MADLINMMAAVQGLLVGDILAGIFIYALGMMKTIDL